MEENLKKTCLYDEHLALEAQMSPFAGYMMPIRYSGITEEHDAVRSRAGVFDVSHMGEIFISGPDAEKLVSYLFSNDISKMEDGDILYGMILYPDGGTVDDLLVYKEFRKNSYILVVNAANIEKDYEWIKSNSSAYDALIENRSDNWGQLAVQGPEAESIAEKVLGEELSSLRFYTFKDFIIGGERVIVSRTGYTGEDGFEIYAPKGSILKFWKDFLKAGALPCGLGCRDTLRFEAGLPLYGSELGADISPLEAGLGMFCKLEKEDFIGKQALVSKKEAGLSRKLVGIELEDKAVPRAGYPVELEDGKEVGIVTTGYRSITLDKSLCFAMVDWEYSGLGTRLNIRIRKRVFPGLVVKKRFYQANYKK